MNASGRINACAKSSSAQSKMKYPSVAGFALFTTPRQSACKGTAAPKHRHLAIRDMPLIWILKTSTTAIAQLATAMPAPTLANPCGPKYIRAFSDALSQMSPLLGTGAFSHTSPIAVMVIHPAIIANSRATCIPALIGKRPSRLSIFIHSPQFGYLGSAIAHRRERSSQSSSLAVQVPRARRRADVGPEAVLIPLTPGAPPQGHRLVRRSASTLRLPLRLAGVPRPRAPS